MKKSQSGVMDWISNPIMSKLSGKILSRGDLIPVILLLVPLLIFLPNITSFPYPASGSPFSDVTTTHYPNAVYLLRAIREWQTIPLWSPTIFSGYPLVGHPLSGLFYPFGWLALLFSLPAGFNLLAVAHLVWGGLGMYVLMRLEGRTRPGALFAGLAFACLPKIFAHYGAGHLTIIYAIVWTPWLLASYLVGEDSQSQNRLLHFLPGIILGIVLLADIRWGGLTLVLYVSYIFSHRHLDQLSIYIIKIIKQTLLACLIAAPFLFPFIEFTQSSTRALLTGEDTIQHSLPFLRIINLLVPDLISNHEWVIYPGALVCVLALIALVLVNEGGKGRYWGIVAAISLVFSFGANLPGLNLLLDLPGLDLLRVPARTLFLTSLSLTALAGIGLDVILNDLQSSHQRSVKLALVGFSSLVIVMSLALYFYFQVSQIILIVEMGLVLASSAWLMLAIEKKIPTQVWLVGIFAISIFDWIYLARMSIVWRESEEVLSEVKSVAQYLSSQEGLFRTYSPSYSLPQHAAVQYNLELADGVDPLQLASYVEFMNQASGVPNPGYSVTLPPFVSGAPGTDNRDYFPDVHLLGLLNVRYVLSAFNIRSDGLILENQIGEIRIYRNLYQRPRAWIQSDLVEPDGVYKEANIVYWSPTLIEVDTEGSGILVLSEIAYPGWRVSVDGDSVESTLFANTFRSINLDEGKHLVRFTFRPFSLYLGLAGWLLLAFGILASRMSRETKRRSNRR